MSLLGDRFFGIGVPPLRGDLNGNEQVFLLPFENGRPCPNLATATVEQILKGASGGAVISDTPPVNPGPGTFWFDTTTGLVNVWDGSQWHPVGITNVFTATENGLVPATGEPVDDTHFLRADGIWIDPEASFTAGPDADYVMQPSDRLVFITQTSAMRTYTLPAIATNGIRLRVIWSNAQVTIVPPAGENILTVDGAAQILVVRNSIVTPAPSGYLEFVLSGSWVVVKSSQFTGTWNGDVPASGGGTANFLRADGTWAAPPTPTVPVASVFGRTGAVVAVANDYSFTQISGTALPAQLPLFTSALQGAVPPPGANIANFLRGDGQWVAVAPQPSPAGRVTIFNVTGTYQFTASPNTQMLLARVKGGGGGGGGVNGVPNVAASGGGGGEGGYSERMYIRGVDLPTAQVPVVVGGGGTGSVGADTGVAGGQSYFVLNSGSQGTWVTGGNGGIGGDASNIYQNPEGGAGGGAGGLPSWFQEGQAGQAGMAWARIGAGGTTFPFAKGGDGGGGSARGDMVAGGAGQQRNGRNPNSPGCGGSGAAWADAATAAMAGGNGMAGYVIIYEWF